MKAKNPAATSPCTASTRARSAAGRLAPKAAIMAPNSARMRTHSTIEPSWFAQTPVIL